MDNKMILQFILNYSLDAIDLANAIISSPSKKKLIFMQCFHYGLFHDRKQKESTDYRTLKKFRTFYGSF